MPKKTLTKILLDIIMTLLYIFLMFGYNISPLLHELFGIIIGILFIVHLWLNRKPWLGMRKAYKKGNLSSQNKRKMIYDIVLMVALPIAIITGVLISQELFSMQLYMPIYATHKLSSFVALIVLALHIGTHAKYLKNALSRLFRKENSTQI